MYFGEQNDVENGKYITLWLLLASWDRQQSVLEVREKDYLTAKAQYEQCYTQYNEITARAKILMDKLDFKNVRDLRDRLDSMGYFTLVDPSGWFLDDPLPTERLQVK